MIKGILTSSPYLHVGGVNAPYVSMSTPSAGMVRYNGNLSNLEVYDGSYWQQISNFQDINLTQFANSVLDWASKKMLEEQVREQLASQNPSIAIALENLKRAEEQLQTTIHLSKEHDL